MTFDTDFLIIGSGFGGSVSALRLTEKGYKVSIAEQGSHISAENMPRSVSVSLPNLRNIFCKTK